MSAKSKIKKAFEQLIANSPAEQRVALQALSKEIQKLAEKVDSLEG